MDCCQLPAEGIWTGVETRKLFCWYGDDCGAFANLLYYLNSHIVPRACCFYRNGVEDVCVCLPTWGTWCDPVIIIRTDDVIWRRGYCDYFVTMCVCVSVCVCLCWWVCRCVR